MNNTVISAKVKTFGTSRILILWFNCANCNKNGN